MTEEPRRPFQIKLKTIFYLMTIVAAALAAFVQLPLWLRAAILAWGGWALCSLFNFDLIDLFTPGSLPGANRATRWRYIIKPRRRTPRPIEEDE